MWCNAAWPLRGETSSDPAVSTAAMFSVRGLRQQVSGHYKHLYCISTLKRQGPENYRTPGGARFSAPVQTSPVARPASCTMCTGSFPGVKSGRGVTLTPHPLLEPWSRKNTFRPLLPLWAVWPVQSLSAWYKGALKKKCLPEVWHILPETPCIDV